MQSINYLLDTKQLDLKLQIGIRRNVRRTSRGAIGQLARNKQPALAADFHGAETFVPALNQPTNPEVSRAAGLVRIVELLPILQPADVLDLDCLARLRARAIADPEILNPQTGCGRDFGSAALLRRAAARDEIRHRCNHKDRNQDDGADLQISVFARFIGYAGRR